MHSYGSDGNFEFFHQINKDMSFTVRGNYTFSQNIIDYYEENKLPYDYLSVTGNPLTSFADILQKASSPVKKKSTQVPTKADSAAFVREISNIVT